MMKSLFSAALQRASAWLCPRYRLESAVYLDDTYRQSDEVVATWHAPNLSMVPLTLIARARTWWLRRTLPKEASLEERRAAIARMKPFHGDELWLASNEIRDGKVRCFPKNTATRWYGVR